MGKLSGRNFWDDRYEHLNGLPEHILLDLARNDACPVEYRLTAVEIMLKKGHKKAQHPDLARFREVLEAEKAEFGEREIPVSEPENDQSTQQNTPKTGVLAGISGTPSASVTTATMFARPKIDFESISAALSDPQSTDSDPEIPENGQESSD